MTEMLPINKEILKWARVSLNLTMEDVAGRMGKPVSFIQEWENGISSPTYSQLEKMAYQIYKRPVALFFFPEVPEEAAPKADFRTLPERMIESLSTRIVQLYRKAKVLQMNLEELYEGKAPEGSGFIDKFSLDATTNIVDFTERVRGVLGVDLEKQFAWSNQEVAFNEWRNSLEKNGIFVFNDAFRDETYSGFCLYDERYPVIYVNNTLPASRQIFTLFHELAHLFYKSGGIDFRSTEVTDTFPKPYRQIEQNCNRYAAEILVPKKVLMRMALTVSEERISELANQFSVSREVILRNYLNLKLIDERKYRDLAGKWIKEAKTAVPSKGGNYYYTQRKYLGEKYTHLAFHQYYQNRIGLETLAQYLGMKVKYVLNFEHFALS